MKTRNLRWFLFVTGHLLLLSNLLEAQTSLALSSATAPAAGNAILNLTLSEPSSNQLAALQWTFTYPASKTASFTAAAGPALASASKTLSCTGGAGTYTCVAWGENTNSVAAGVVATLSVTLSGNADVPVSVSNSLGASLTGDSISVAAAGGTVTAVTAISSVACSPGTLAPSGASTCTVNLSGTGGATIGLNSSSTNLSVPASLTIPTGTSSGTFPATAKAFTADQTVTVTASLSGSSVPATISLVAPVTVSSLQCAAGSLASNVSTTCTVTLSKSAATATIVTLTNSASPLLTVPASVSVPANANSTTFSASTGTLVASQSATVTATLNGSSAATTISLIAPAVTVSSLHCAAASLGSNASTTCTVTLSNSPTTATSVTLSSNSPTLTVPASVSVPANANSATFTASTGVVVSNQSAAVTATLNGSSAATTISLAAPVITVSALQCAAASLGSNASTMCTVTLSNSPTTATSVTLSDNAPSLTVPASVSVPANANSATFTASTGVLVSSQSATVTATLNGSSAATAISLTAPSITVSALQCAALSLFSNASTTCTVTLSNPSGAATSVTLSGSAASLTVPASVNVPANAASATFSASTGALLSDQTATVTAALNGSSKAVTLSLIAPATLSALQCAAATLTSNANTSCTVALSKAAPAGGVAVSISSSLPSVLSIAQSNLMVPAGAPSASFTASTSTIAAPQGAVITVTVGTAQLTTSISLTPAPTVKPLSLSCTPVVLTPGVSGNCLFSLGVPAAAPTVVKLKPTNAGFTIPATLTIATGAISGSAAFTTSSTLTGWVILLATSGSMSQTFTFTVPARSAATMTSLTSIACDKRVTPGHSGVCELRLSPSDNSEPAPISVTSSSSRLKVPARLLPEPGQKVIRFEVAADPEASDTNAILEVQAGESRARDTVAIVSSGPNVLAPRRVAGTPEAPVRFSVSASGGATIAAAGLPSGAVFDSNIGAFEWLPAATALGEYEVAFVATDAQGSHTRRSVLVHVGTGAPVISQLHNAAVGKMCSPGAIAVVYGSFLSTADAPLEDRSGRSSALGETRVLVNGAYARVLSTSTEQVEFLCPMLTAGTLLQIAVETPSGRSRVLKTIMEEVAPAILTADGSPHGQALAIRANGTELAALPSGRFMARPALPGEVISMRATGVECAVSPGLSVIVGGQPATIDFARPESETAGVCEIAFQIPASVAGDAVSLVIAITRSDAIVSSSNRTTVAVRNPSTETNVNASYSNLEEIQ